MSSSKKKHLRPLPRYLSGPKPVEPRASLSGQLVRWCVAWFRAKNPVLRFVVVFGLLLGLFYAVVPPSSFHNTLSAPYLRFSARMASPVCNWFGQRTSAVGATISSARFSLRIGPNCDASDPSALFVAAVLAFPVPFRRKIPGILLGAMILAVVNLVRIVSLFLVGVYFPKAFDWMHVEVWSAIFILLAIVLWTLWIQWAMKFRPVTSHVPS
ncbi:MAG: exosortase H [Verrucomicrobiota bacterium]